MNRICISFLLVLCAAAGAFAQTRRTGPLSRGLRGNRRGAMAAQQQQQNETASAAAEEAIENAPRGTNGVPALVFDKAPLEIVLKAYADEVQKTIIPAPDLPKAEITLKSLEGQVLEKEEYLEAIEVVLGMNGVVLEPRGEKFLRALARKTVRTQGIPILMQNKGNLPEQGRVVSQMITFQNIAATEAQKALEGFKDPSGLFQVFERTNAILVTDTQENINRMLEVVRAIDIASPVMEDVFTVQIKYALAADIKTALETIVTESQKEQPKETVTTKNSGTPGFTRSQPSGGGRLLNLNRRPGQQQQEQPASTANETLMAAVSDADRGMIRGKVLILDDERSNKLIIITSKANMKFFDKVIETLDVETTPDVQIKVFRLKYAECEDVASMLNDLIGNASSGSSQSKGNQTNTAATKSAGGSKNLTTGSTAQRQRTKSSSGALNTSKVGELNKDNCKVLADKRINGVVVYARTQDMSTLKKIIDEMDIKLSQVLIETAIIEVSLGDNLKTGVDWVMRGRAKTQRQDSNGNPLYWAEYTSDITKTTDGTTTVLKSAGEKTGLMTTEKSWTDNDKVVHLLEPVVGLVRDGYANNGNFGLGGGGGGLGGAGTEVAKMMSKGISYSGAATEFGTMTPIGSGVNYLLKSDKLNLAAIIQATKSDNRAKYIASPVVMTVDNKEATIDATENRQFLTGWTANSGSINGTSGQPTPSYSSKDIGIKLKITPKINPNGTVMLEVEEEYSQFKENGQSMLIPQSSGSTISYTPGYVDLAVERKMSADVLLEDRQTVVLGGMTETSEAESETGIPILKDIPWIGKWLFGSVSQVETRKELLVFMTPYVLDDADSAQAEALRRKKALSDARPWVDHGWSASELADPVSKKEQLRRFNDEWARQDEERKTKLAIEKAKIDRAKKLEKMDEKEREFWLELHKDELEKEEKEAFEAQMEEQKDLRELAASIREKKMKAAEEKLKAEEAQIKADAEYARVKKEQEERAREKEKAESVATEAAADPAPSAPAGTTEPASVNILGDLGANAEAAKAQPASK